MSKVFLKSTKIRPVYFPLSILLQPNAMTENQTGTRIKIYIRPGIYKADQKLIFSNSLEGKGRTDISL